MSNNEMDAFKAGFAVMFLITLITLSIVGSFIKSEREDWKNKLSSAKKEYAQTIENFQSQAVEKGYANFLVNKNKKIVFIWVEKGKE